MNKFIITLVLGLFCSPAFAAMEDPAVPADMKMAGETQKAHMVNVLFDDIVWETEELPNGQTFEMSILRSDEASGDTAMIVRAKAGTQVPKHWHTANEQIIVIEGVLNIESEGHTVSLSKGGFHFLPSKVLHRAWANDNDDILIFIAADAPWDINFVEE